MKSILTAAVATFALAATFVVGAQWDNWFRTEPEPVPVVAKVDPSVAIVEAIENLGSGLDDKLTSLSLKVERNRTPRPPIKVEDLIGSVPLERSRPKVVEAPKAPVQTAKVETPPPAPPATPKKVAAAPQANCAGGYTVAQAPTYTYTYATSPPVTYTYGNTFGANCAAPNYSSAMRTYSTPTYSYYSAPTYSAPVYSAAPVQRRTYRGLFGSTTYTYGAGDVSRHRCTPFGCYNY